MKTTVKVISYGLWVIGLLLVSKPVMAQVGNSNLYETAPGVTFQSTSTMTGSSSSYSSNPVLNEDGSAAFGGSSAAHVPAGPRHAPTPINNQEDMDKTYGEGLNPPVGDALVPLMLFALLFSALIFLRRRGVKE